MSKRKDDSNLTPEEKMKKYYLKQFVRYKIMWSYSSPQRKLVENNARVKVDTGYYKWRCNSCNLLFAKSEIELDHIIPIGKTPTNKEEFIRAIDLNETDNIQVLCCQCHKIKTNTQELNKKKELCIEEIEKLMEEQTLLIPFQYSKMTYVNMKRARCLLRQLKETDDEKKKRLIIRKLESMDTL